MTTRPPSDHARPSGTSSIASSSTSHHTLHVAGNADNAEGKAKKDKSRKTHQKIRLSKKAGSSGTGSSIRAVKTGAEEDDDWTFEGGEADPGMNGNSRVRESMEAVRELREPQSYAVAPIGGVQASSDQKDKERESKGRRLVKKTSQLFGRKDKDKDKDRDRLSSNPASSSSSVYLPMASRQSSKSSGESQEQMNRQRPLASRVPSGGSTMTTNGSALGGGFLGTRRPSQEAQAALGAYAGNGSGIGAIRPKPRTGSSSTYESSIDAPSPLLTSGPLPGTGQRRPSQLSNLSSSVSALPRPPTQPIPTSATQPQGPSVPTRMSAWFSGLISSSAGSETSTQSSEPTTSPLRPTGPSAAVTRGPSAAASFLNAARQKAVEGVRNLLDSEAQPDRCTEPIWLMGVSHPGYTPPLASPPFGQVTHHIGENGNGARPGSSGSGSGEGPLSTPPQTEREKGLRAGWQKRQMDRPPGSPAKGLGQLFGGSTVSLVGSPSKDGGRVEDSPSRGKKGKEREVLKWPEEFYTDFRSTVWCTYRSQYAPIISIPQDTLIPSAERYYAAFGPPADLQILHTDAAPEHNAQVPTSNGLSSKPSAWGWGRSEERGLTSDAGWGCMLRTGQSMLANALISLHLGRGWRVPLQPPSLEPTTPAELLAMQQYATYARILSYFQDDPSPLAPFSVHRMALIGKALGKEVGEWFGPSTAQGALKTLANAFPPCGLTVVGGIDGMVYRSEVIEASNADDGDWAVYNAVKDPESLGNGSSKHKQEKKGRLSKLYTDTGGDEGKWGKKAVLVLVGLRLGLDGVNPIYHDSIKTLFTFPQSVGIAGGRPSSSYYFVASQANSLFYLDPHFTRPAIPLEVPPSFTAGPNTDDTVKEATSTARTATQPKQTGSSSSASSPSLNQSDDFLASSVTVPASETVDNEEAILLPDMSASAILADERAQGAEPVPMQGQGPGYKPYKLDMVDVDDASSGSEPSFSPTRPPRSSAFAEGPKTNLVPPSTFVPPSTSRSSSMLSPPASPHVGYSRKSSAATTGTAEMRESDVFSAPIHAGKGARTGGIEVDAETRWYASAYAEAQLKTYHCDKVRKIPLSALDPSMLLGFLCRDEADFEDFCERVVRLPQKIFSVLDEPPTWDDGASAGLESVSEPDFSSEDEDEDETDAIDSPLGDSLTLPNRNHNNLTIKPVVPRGRTLSTGSDEDLSATVRTLSVGMERDETVRGGLSGVVDSSGPHDGTKLGVEGDDDSLPPTPRVVAPPAFFSRPSVVLVERPEEDEPRNAIPRPSPSEADTVRR